MHKLHDKTDSHNLMLFYGSALIWISLATDQLSRIEIFRLFSYLIFLLTILVTGILIMIVKKSKGDGTNIYSKQKSDSMQEWRMVFKPWLQSTFLFVLNTALLKWIFSKISGLSYYTVPFEGEVIVTLMLLAFVGHPLLWILGHHESIKNVVKRQIYIIILFLLMIMACYFLYLKSHSVHMINSSISGLFIACTVVIDRQIKLMFAEKKV